MRVSTKGRYGLAVMLCLAEKQGQNLTAVDIAKKLGISKIYLEQVLALLKNAQLVQSLKGSQGGYYLDTASDKLSAYDILKATEASIFEPVDNTLGINAAHYEAALNKTVWTPLDASIVSTLKNITLQDILNGTKSDAFMFYI
jgi:Rrf2 family protein